MADWQAVDAWRVSAFAAGEDVTGAALTIAFEGDGRIHGSAGCNRYFGRYETGPGGALRISSEGVTRMACEPAMMETERRFLDALDAVRGAQVEGHRLVLTDADGETLLVLEPDEG